jgi:hypothetical protein
MLVAGETHIVEHPELGVALCQPCAQEYIDNMAAVEKADDVDLRYCTWCGTMEENDHREEIYLECLGCKASFCSSCLEHVIEEGKLSLMKELDPCFVCGMEEGSKGHSNQYNELQQQLANVEPSHLGDFMHDTDVSDNEEDARGESPRQEIGTRRVEATQEEMIEAYCKLKSREEDALESLEPSVINKVKREVEEELADEGRLEGDALKDAVDQEMAKYSALCNREVDQVLFAINMKQDELVDAGINVFALAMQLDEHAPVHAMSEEWKCAARPNNEGDIAAKLSAEVALEKSNPKQYNRDGTQVVVGSEGYEIGTRTTMNILSVRKKKKVPLDAPLPNILKLELEGVPGLKLEGLDTVDEIGDVETEVMHVRLGAGEYEAALKNENELLAAGDAPRPRVVNEDHDKKAEKVSLKAEVRKLSVIKRRGGPRPGNGGSKRRGKGQSKNGPQGGDTLRISSKGEGSSTTSSADQASLAEQAMERTTKSSEQNEIDLDPTPAVRPSKEEDGLDPIPAKIPSKEVDDDAAVDGEGTLTNPVELLSSDDEDEDEDTAHDNDRTETRKAAHKKQNRMRDNGEDALYPAPSTQNAWSDIEEDNVLDDENMVNTDEPTPIKNRPPVQLARYSTECDVCKRNQGLYKDDKGRTLCCHCLLFPKTCSVQGAPPPHHCFGHALNQQSEAALEIKSFELRVAVEVDTDEEGTSPERSTGKFIMRDGMIEEIHHPKRHQPDHINKATAPCPDKAKVFILGVEVSTIEKKIVNDEEGRWIGVELFEYDDDQETFLLTLQSNDGQISTSVKIGEHTLRRLKKKKRVKQHARVHKKDKKPKKKNPLIKDLVTSSDEEDSGTRSQSKSKPDPESKSRHQKGSLCDDYSGSSDDDESRDKSNKRKRLKKSSSCLGTPMKEDTGVKEEDDAGLESDGSDDLLNPVSKIRRTHKRGLGLDDDDDDDDDDDHGFASSGKRKNISAILEENQLAESTREAMRQAEEKQARIDRLKQQRKKRRLDVTTKRLSSDICINEDEIYGLSKDEQDERGVFIHDSFSRRLKEHQIEGVKFIWNNVVESVARLKLGDDGMGCILAHSMGLGKTIQCVAILYTLLMNTVVQNACKTSSSTSVDSSSENETEEGGDNNQGGTQLKTALVLTPVNTLTNWQVELKKWLPEAERQRFTVYNMNDHKKTHERLDNLKAWKYTGGVLVLGYDMFKNLVTPLDPSKKNAGTELSL